MHQRRRDPRAAVAAFTAAVLASAWLAVAAWGSRDSATPLPAQQTTTTDSTDQSSTAGSYDQAPSMSTGQS